MCVSLIFLFYFIHTHICIYIYIIILKRDLRHKPFLGKIPLYYNLILKTYLGWDIRKHKFKLILISKVTSLYNTHAKSCHSVVKRIPNFESENLTLHARPDTFWQCNFDKSFDLSVPVYKLGITPLS